jgi:hypothetical protein
MMLVERPMRGTVAGSMACARWIAVVVITSAWMLASQVHAWTTVSDGTAPSPDMGALHRAISRYGGTSAALAAGYVATASCDTDRVVGARTSYGHPLMLSEPTIVLERPQLLVYEARPVGGAQLRAVAYRVGQRAWHEAGNGLRPALFGLRFELVERAGGASFYQLVVHVSAATVRFIVEHEPALGDCGGVGPG